MPLIHASCLGLNFPPEDVAFVDMIKPEARLLVTGVESMNAPGLWPVVDALEAAAARRGNDRDSSRLPYSPTLRPDPMERVSQCAGEGGLARATPRIRFFV
jgi:hypothetical protein